MPRVFKFGSDVGDEDVAYLHIMGSRVPSHYFRATIDLVTYPGTSFGEVIQRIENDGVPVLRNGVTTMVPLYVYDPATYPSNELRRELEYYASAKLAARAKRRIERDKL